MAEPVILEIRGYEIGEEGELAQPICLTTMATASWEGEAVCLRYEETEVVGFAGTVTTVTAEPGRVVVERQGTSVMAQTFIVGHSHTTQYCLPMGTLLITVLPQKVQVELGEGSGTIDMTYGLGINGQDQGNQHLYMSFRRLPKGSV